MSRSGRLARDDAGVSEVIGFVLSFALSAVFLMISLNTFFLAKSNSDDVVSGAELKVIADRVASRVVEAGLIGAEFDSATVNMTLDIPQDLNGHPYYIEARSHGVYANISDLDLSAVATTFNLDVVDGFDVTGKVYSSNEKLVITYSLQNAGTTRSIHIHEVS